MTKAEYLAYRDRYTPPVLEIIFVLESPPASGRYFYNPDGPVTEPLFRAMMKDVLGLETSSKEEGLRAFTAQGYLILDATYTPVNKLSGAARDATICRDFPARIGELRKCARPHTRIVLIKANVCRLLEPRLVPEDFNVVNRGMIIPFPASGQQAKFRAAIQQLLFPARSTSLRMHGLLHTSSECD